LARANQSGCFHSRSSRISAFQEHGRIHREILPVAVTARRAVDSNLELSARHCG
jgi:hypothetical protein